MHIGKIARSSSHIDYVCQVYQPGEVSEPPGPDDYAFGTLVRIGERERPAIVGLIYDTILVNPDFGSLGPRLSPAQDLAIFSPDYLNERQTLAGIIAIGTWDGRNPPIHGVPRQAAQIDSPVERLGEKEIAAFHTVEDGSVRIGYAPLLLAHGSPLARHLLLTVIERLEQACPQAHPHLQVLAANIAWRAAVEPLG